MQVSRRGPAFSVVMYPKKVSASMHLKKASAAMYPKKASVVMRPKKASAGGPPKRRLPADAFGGERRTRGADNRCI